MELQFIKGETELNRARIYDDSYSDPVGEINFAVSDAFIQKVYEEEYADKYETVDEFLDWYEPETDGEHIYQRAIREGELIQDLGECIYGTIKIL